MLPNESACFASPSVLNERHGALRQPFIVQITVYQFVESIDWTQMLCYDSMCDLRQAMAILRQPKQAVVMFSKRLWT